MARVVFSKIGTGQDEYADSFSESVKMAMPKDILIQVTDGNTPKLKSADEVIRFDSSVPYSYENHPDIILENLSRLPFEEFIAVDADMIFTGDVGEVLNGDFDVAICGRQDGDDTTSPVFRREHPYNGGFMVFKNKRFINAWRERAREADPAASRLFVNIRHKKFLKAQYCLGTLIDSGDYRVKFLDPFIYNNTPKFIGDFNDKTKVWHFKGAGRKEWMTSLWKTLQNG